jgi:hypothetical protein
MFGVDFRRCLSLGSGAKPLQVFYFFLLGVVVCGLSEGRVEGKLNNRRAYRQTTPGKYITTVPSTTPNQA